LVHKTGVGTLLVIGLMPKAVVAGIDSNSVQTRVTAEASAQVSGDSFHFDRHFAPTDVQADATSIKPGLTGNGWAMPSAAVRYNDGADLNFEFNLLAGASGLGNGSGFYSGDGKAEGEGLFELTSPARYDITYTFTPDPRRDSGSSGEIRLELPTFDELTDFESFGSSFTPNGFTHHLSGFLNSWGFQYQFSLNMESTILGPSGSPTERERADRVWASLTITSDGSSWRSPVSGTFGDSTRWDTGVVPSAATTTFFEDAGTYTVSVSTDEQVRRLYITQGDVTFDFLTGRTLSASAGAIVNGNMHLVSGRLDAGASTVTGNASIDAASEWSVTGDYQQFSGAKLSVQIQDKNGYGRLTATGSAHLSGNLEVTLPTGAVLRRGDRYRIVSAANVDGTFDNAPRFLDADGHALVVSYDSTAVTLKPMSKYKQFYGSWASMQINPDAKTPRAMSSSGCTLTALAAAVGIYGNDVTPGQVLAEVQRRGAFQGHTNAIDVNSFSYTTSGNDGKPITVSVAGRGGDWSTVISSLQAGNPVMLAVPSYSRTVGLSQGEPGTLIRKANGELHYVLAYGLNQNIIGAASPQDVYIDDPGYGNSFYGGSGWTLDVDGNGIDTEENSNVTLAKYFSEVNERSAFVFDAETWFNEHSFTDHGGVFTYVLPEARHNQLITRFTTGAQNIRSSINANSPVELVLTDPVTGRRYVTSLELLQPGDTLLSKEAFDDVAAVDDPLLTEDGIESDPFPPYSIPLPDELVGHSLDLQIIGVGDGDYYINYVTGTDLYTSSMALSGIITDGQSIPGSFSITAVPEPLSLPTLAAALVLATCRRPRICRKLRSRYQRS
jgi:hypothetical protein